jgi:nucleoside-diphosphate-sugar epimerase
LPGERVMVTGAGGFIGRHVVEALAKREYRIRATDLPGVDLVYAEDLGAEVVKGDLLDCSFASRVTSGMDGVIHAAAAFDLGLPRQCLLSTNVNTTRNVARASAASSVKMFVQYSTCDVFGLKRKGPTMEDEPKKPRCAYSLSKLLSEYTAMGVMRQRGLPVAVVRPTFVYGPGAVYTAGSFVLLPSLLSRYIDTLPLPSGGPRTNTVHVEDMAEATVQVLEAKEKAAGLSFNVADDTMMCANEFLRFILEPFGIDCSRSFDISWNTIEAVGRITALLPQRLFASISRVLGVTWDRVLLDECLEPLLRPKLDRDFVGYLYGEHLYANDRIKSLGWSPRYPTFADGWAHTVKWYGENRLIPWPPEKP